MVTSDDELKNELEDFESFLEDNFDAKQLSNDLLLITNGNENPELDLNTPIKKLKFDIDECNKRMSKVSSKNYSSLISNFSEFERCSNILETRIKPQIDRINQPFNRIKKEVIEPYDEAVKLNNALKKIHSTLKLLRVLSFFVFLIQQLEEFETKSQSEEIGEDLIKLAKIHVQLNELYESSRIENNDILSVKLVRDYQSIEITRRKNLIHELSSFIINEYSHSSRILINNKKLQNNLISLYYLDAKEFYTVFDKATINKKVTISINQLTKALQSPRNFTAIVSEVYEESKNYFQKINSTLSTWKLSNEESEQVSLLEKILHHHESKSLSNLYWSMLTSRLKKTIVATMARGGPIAKNLKVYYQGLTNSVNEMFKDQCEKDLILDALSMINYQ